MVIDRCIDPKTQDFHACSLSQAGQADPKETHGTADQSAHTTAEQPAQTTLFAAEQDARQIRTERQPLSALRVHNRFDLLQSQPDQSAVDTDQASASECKLKTTPLTPTQEKPSLIPIPVASWNIGGSSIQSAVQSTIRAEGTKPLLLCLQEMPRRPVGWHTDTEAHYSIVQYRHDDDQWRGNAIAYTSDFQVIRRRGCRFGIWLRLRHLRTHNEFWVGSLRLSTGVNSDVTADELRTMCHLLPATLLPVVLLGDFNTKLKWTDALDPRGDMRPTEARSEYVLSELGSCGMQLRAPTPEQWDTPTSRPRRTRVRGHQIDGLAFKSARLDPVHILVDSFKQIGGDHDRISSCFHIREGQTVEPPRAITRPRVVTRKPPTLEHVSQGTLQQLAISHTKVKPGSRYKDPPEVKELYRAAKNLQNRTSMERCTQGKTTCTGTMENCPTRAGSSWQLAELQGP